MNTVDPEPKRRGSVAVAVAGRMIAVVAVVAVVVVVAVIAAIAVTVVAIIGGSRGGRSGNHDGDGQGGDHGGDGVEQLGHGSLSEGLNSGGTSCVPVTPPYEP